LDLRAKAEPPGARVLEALFPADLAQLALGFWERRLAGDRGASQAFMAACRVLERTAEQHSDGLRWPYDIRVPKYGIEPPTYSGLAQGQIASVFVRAYQLTGDPRHSEIASSAIEPLLDGHSDLVSETPLGPIVEEGQSHPPSHILNGWIYALWGLRDVHVAFGHRRAGDMWSASTGCLRAMVPRYDVGWWTKYSLYPHVLADLAKPFYHRLHIDQMEIMYRLTGFSEFASAARRWRAYDNAIHRSAAILQKVLFVMTK
jgi:hypothetical protein